MNIKTLLTIITFLVFILINSSSSAEDLIKKRPIHEFDLGFGAGTPLFATVIRATFVNDKSYWALRYITAASFSLRGFAGGGAGQPPPSGPESIQEMSVLYGEITQRRDNSESGFGLGLGLSQGSNSTRGDFRGGEFQSIGIAVEAHNMYKLSRRVSLVVYTYGFLAPPRIPLGILLSIRINDGTDAGHESI